MNGEGEGEGWEKLAKGTTFERTIRWLRRNGFIIRQFEIVNVTLANDRIRKVPRVYFVVYSATLVDRADELAKLLRGVGMPVTPPTIAASYFPANGTTVLALSGVDDTNLPGGIGAN